MSLDLKKTNGELVRKVFAIATILLMTLLAACSGSNSGPSPARANAPQTIQVTVAPVGRQDLPIYLNGLGSVEAFYTVSVKSRVDGQLVQVKFREGVARLWRRFPTASGHAKSDGGPTGRHGAQRSSAGGQRETESFVLSHHCTGKRTHRLAAG